LLGRGEIKNRVKGVGWGREGDEEGISRGKDIWDREGTKGVRGEIESGRRREG
jgi:hypothetical protein